MTPGDDGETDLETDGVLRGYAGRWRDEQPPPPLLDEVPAVARSHRQPMNRPLRWPAGIAAAVVVGAVAAGSIALGHRTRDPAAGPRPSVTVVPFRDDGQRDPASLSPLLRRHAIAPDGIPACAGADFVLVSSSTAVEPSDLTFPGHVTTRYLLRSAGASSCAMDVAGPQVVLVDGNGNRLTDHDLGPSLSGPHPQPLLVRRGDLVQGSVSWSATDRGPRPAAILIAPEDAVALRSRLQIDISHVVTPTGPTGRLIQSGWASRLDSIAAPGALGSLTAVLSAPADVRTRSTMGFTVDLINRTDVAVPLTTCPSYDAHLTVYDATHKGVVASSSGYRGRLNCSAAPGAIAPGSTVRFEFRLSTRGLTPGYGRLNWTLGPAATAVDTDVEISVAR